MIHGIGGQQNKAQAYVAMHPRVYTINDLSMGLRDQRAVREAVAARLDGEGTLGTWGNDRGHHGSCRTLLSCPDTAFSGAAAGMYS